MIEDTGGRPAISVVCPAYNSAAFIHRALESVGAQTSPPFEVIVSDDGSTDCTGEVSRIVLGRYPHLRFRVVTNAHSGPGSARNAGIRASTGDWVAFLDSDDAWRPEKLARVRAAMQRDPRANFFCHSQEHVRRDGTTAVLDYAGRFYDPARPLVPQLFRHNLFLTSSVVCRRDLLLEAGLYDEGLMSGQDYELWLRMAPRLEPHFIREVLGEYRDREGSISTLPAWRRWRNAVIIAWRHRHKAAWPDVAFRLLYLTAYFAKHNGLRIRANQS